MKPTIVREGALLNQRRTRILLLLNNQDNSKDRVPLSGAANAL